MAGVRFEGDEMALLTIELNDDMAAQVRSLVHQLQTGKVSLGPVSLLLDRLLEFDLTREDDHVKLSWDGKMELDGPMGADPDLMRVRLYEDHAEVDARISGVRINY